MFGIVSGLYNEPNPTAQQLPGLDSSGTQLLFETIIPYFVIVLEEQMKIPTTWCCCVTTVKIGSCTYATPPPS
jgi:hypothetical protein